MPKTGAHLKVLEFGDNVLGVRLNGNPRNPEPITFRVAFPGGDVDIDRLDDGSYWVHIRVDHPEHPGYNPELCKFGPSHVVNGRLDVVGKSASEVDMGDFDNPELYHVAIRVKRDALK